MKSWPYNIAAVQKQEGEKAIDALLKNIDKTRPFPYSVLPSLLAIKKH